jgi:predicted ABC-type ATPase
MSDRPVLHVLAGSNGAGKTSLYEAWLKSRVDAEFVNADRLVFEAIGAHATTEEHAKLGQRLAEERRAALIAAGKSLIAESTFSHESKVDLVWTAKAQGYDVLLYHVGVDSADLAVARVGERFANGGHPVPEDRIRGRYIRNRGFIRDAMRLADGGWVFDNSQLGVAPWLAITFQSGKVLTAATDLPSWAAEVYAVELAEYASRES